ncbi:YwpF family protein [Bacillus sp. PS06]|uniref:YwpF family protein n=1 Tax=Bacillus sp. PS06 TaxID=2764176 RepID=UPI0017850799|nr:YwpF family protein [Bacillus sp. PS06]MBD8069451.1 hypothetical protein [Bacillus sp. PS06]
MKTFRLVSLSVLPDSPSEEEIVEVDLIEGLIINREDNDRRWIIEAFIDKSYTDLFTTYKASNRELQLRVKITDESNEPAFVVATIMSINVLSEHLSVLFDAKIARTKFVNSEVILAQLLQQGLQGEELLKQFNHLVHQERKKLKTVK